MARLVQEAQVAALRSIRRAPTGPPHGLAAQPRRTRSSGRRVFARQAVGCAPNTRSILMARLRGFHGGAPAHANATGHVPGALRQRRCHPQRRHSRTRLHMDGDERRVPVPVQRCATRWLEQRSLDGRLLPLQRDVHRGDPQPRPRLLQRLHLWLGTRRCARADDRGRRVARRCMAGEQRVGAGHDPRGKEWRSGRCGSAADDPAQRRTQLRHAERGPARLHGGDPRRELLPRCAEFDRLARRHRCFRQPHGAGQRALHLLRRAPAPLVRVLLDVPDTRVHAERWRQLGQPLPRWSSAAASAGRSSIRAAWAR